MTLTTLEPTAIRLDASAQDLNELQALVRRGIRVQQEHFDNDTHLAEVVGTPPWSPRVPSGL